MNMKKNYLRLAIENKIRRMIITHTHIYTYSQKMYILTSSFFFVWMMDLSKIYILEEICIAIKCTESAQVVMFDNC